MTTPKTTFAGLALIAALVGALVSGPVSATKHTIGLVCSWYAYFSESETFLVNKKDKTVYWVNENKMLKVKDFNESRILMSGTKTRFKVGRGNKYKQDVVFIFLINRISGDFTVWSDDVPVQSSFSCVIERLF